MQKIIMIKYGELTTKKENIGLFLSALKKNVENTLKNYDVKVIYDKGRMFVEPKNDDYDIIIDKISKVFGIHEIDVVYKVDKNYDLLKQELVKVVKKKEFNTFKVETKRSDKNFFKDSMEISKELGGEILKNLDNKTVDVRNPELLVNIEVRLDAFYIYFDKILGAGGYPVGTAGKGLLMLSGGIDSPVAGYLTNKRGVKLEALYFESPPHTSQEAKEKVISLAKILSLYNGTVLLLIFILYWLLVFICKYIMYTIVIAMNINRIIIKNNITFDLDILSTEYITLTSFI